MFQEFESRSKKNLRTSVHNNKRVLTTSATTSGYSAREWEELEEDENMTNDVISLIEKREPEGKIYFSCWFSK